MATTPTRRLFACRVIGFNGIGVTGVNGVHWDGRDDEGSNVSSGVYYYRLTTADGAAVERMVMVK
jgi:flagellar hook assembly protein FlgD